MLTRRDVAALAWYSALFSAVIGWAALRRDDTDLISRDDGLHRRAAEPLVENDGKTQLRRAVGRMVTQ